jgi:hypothetical protein
MSSFSIERIAAVRCFGIALALMSLGCSAPGDDSSSERVAKSASPAILAPGDCVTSAAGEPWKNGYIPQQSGKFRTILHLLPFEAPIDGVVGLTNGPADSFRDLAAIVRFNSNGFLDVRNGNSYMADLQLPYGAERDAYIHLNVDIPSGVYDVDYEAEDDTLYPLARGYRFRTEQSGVTRLDNAASLVDSATGSFRVCHYNTYRSPQGCLDATAGGGWTSEAFPTQQGQFRVYYEVSLGIPADGLDALVDVVYGLSSGPPTSFSSLAAIFRFNDRGMLDVRDGDVYRADAEISYIPDSVFDVIMDVDLASGTYSVLVSGVAHRREYVPLATNYRFRTQQAGVAQLDHFGFFVDSDFGARVCQLTLDPR